MQREDLHCGSGKLISVAGMVAVMVAEPVLLRPMRKDGRLLARGRIP